MTTYIPKNTEIFFASAADFLTADDDTWLADRMADELPPDPTKDDREQAANALAGWYWWSCCPGCLPDGEASGPFETELEAIQDAGGGEYEDDIYALAVELAVDPADIAEKRYDHFGLKVLACGRAEYAVGTDEEADAAWERSLDSYLDDCGVLDSIPENLRPYFDRAAWKADAKMDGRGHALSSYDGHAIELDDGFVAFRIN